MFAFPLAPSILCHCLNPMVVFLSVVLVRCVALALSCRGSKAPLPCLCPRGQRFVPLLLFDREGRAV